MTKKKSVTPKVGDNDKNWAREIAKDVVSNFKNSGGSFQDPEYKEMFDWMLNGGFSGKKKRFQKK